MRQDQLILLLCTPRSGSTMLQRMIASHPAIATHPEPHLLTHLLFDGYFERVERAPYDHINASMALREFCQELPNGDDDVLEAQRAYALCLYGKVLERTGRPLFLDKTPEYARFASYIVRLLPSARYVVLTRHPLAIWHSQAQSFFQGDYARAAAENPLLPVYVPALARLLREAPVPHVHVRYEDLVVDPESNMRRILDHLDLPFDPRVVSYGKQEHIAKSYGDPMTVGKHDQPVPKYAEQWITDFGPGGRAHELALRLRDQLDPADLQTFGYPAESWFTERGSQDERRHFARFNRYQVQRWVLLRAKELIAHQPAFRRALDRTRYYFDTLLRE